MGEIRKISPYRDWMPKKCCTVTAWHIIFNSDFWDSMAYLSRHCVNIKRGMTLAEINSAFSSVTKYIVKKGNYTTQNRITVSQFVKKHPVGRYYCLVRGHALAIIDGVVYDHSLRPRRQITTAWRVYLSEDEVELERNRGNNGK